MLTDNPGGWGVHLYTDADNTLIENNIIDNNRGGVIFAGEGGEHSDNNVVRNNAITNNGPRWNIEGSWSGGPFGTGNTAYNNCVYSTGPDAPAGIAERDGFSTGSNTVLKSDPYVNGKAGDYRFKAGSPCAALTSRTNARTRGGQAGRAQGQAAVQAQACAPGPQGGPVRAGGARGQAGCARCTSRSASTSAGARSPSAQWVRAGASG